MGGLKTFLAALACLSLAPPACAQALPGADPGRVFATCAGRLSALVEFQWLTDGPASDATARQRDAMAALAEAAAPPGAATRLMHWRLQAKVAQAALLQQAAFGRDPRGTAAARAERLLGECRALLLGQAAARPWAPAGETAPGASGGFALGASHPIERATA